MNDDDEIQLGLDNTSESWKRALLISARGSAAREKRIIALTAGIIALTAATLIVAVVSLIVALVR